MSTKSSGSTIPPGLKKVPPFPPIAARLLALLANPSVEMDEVADLIGSDAKFTARLLQCVNSVEFGLPYQVRNVRQAVALLGLDRTREITVTQATAAYMKGALRSDELRRCWQHTIATAVLADQIAQSCEAFTNVAFTAGIIHDIGRFGLVVAYPREYERIIRNAAELCLDLLDFEREEFGVDHAEAGRFLSEEWGLPHEFRVITGRHHDPSEGTELDLLRIVHVACRLADVLGYDVAHPLGRPSVDDVLAELPTRARERLQASPEQLCSRIDQRILEYDSDTEDPVPEPDPVAEASTIGIETQPELPSVPGLYQNPSVSSRVRFIAAGVAALAIFAALLLWKIQ